jgi:type 1 glutamine amidotransferase
VVFLGDNFPPQRLPDTRAILDDLDALAQRGVGIVCLHYAVGLRAEDVSHTGDHPLLRWIGGYFANRGCPHHESFARIFPQSVIEPAAPQHPVCRGWKAFAIHDEPYFNNYFGPHGNQPAANVTVLAASQLPPDNPKREPVAWCVERADGGRGFGIVMPHFYKNWSHDDLRRLILNAIVWTAQLEVPADGVQTALPDLAAFQPGAVEFRPAPAKKKSAPAPAAQQ